MSHIFFHEKERVEEMILIEQVINYSPRGAYLVEKAKCS